MGDPPAQLSPLSGAYLLIVVGEPFSEEHKQLILQKIQQGKQNYCLMPACNNFFVNFIYMNCFIIKLLMLKMRVLNLLKCCLLATYLFIVMYEKVVRTRGITIKFLHAVFKVQLSVD